MELYDVTYLIFVESFNLGHLGIPWYIIPHIKYVLVMTCLVGQFGINCRSASLKIFKNHERDLSQKSPEPNMLLLVNHTKPTNTSYWN